MSYNIFNAIWDFITGKMEFTDNKLAEERMDICRNCEIRNKTLNVCTICGCFLPLKVKLTKSECPMGKW